MFILNNFVNLARSPPFVQWSEIRELTHRARRGKELEGKDKSKTEALKSVMGHDALKSVIAQI